MHVNPLLAYLVWSASQKATVEAAVLDAAVHGWYEGHIQAHIDRNEEVSVRPEDPENPFRPPFPADGNEKFRQARIVAGHYAGSDRTRIPGAAACAAGLAWLGGYDEAATCTGCSPTGESQTEADQLRRGQRRFELISTEQAVANALHRR